MRFSEIISEGPAQAVGQAVGKTAYNVGSAAGKGVAMLNKATAPDPQAAADSAAIKKGISSGLTKWATGNSELSGSKSDNISTATNNDTLLTGLIDGDTTVSKSAIENFKTKLPTMRLPWTMDINSINAALDQALADKPIDQTQINSLKNLRQHLKKV
jgi:hypothetical protein